MLRAIRDEDETGRRVARHSRWLPEGASAEIANESAVERHHLHATVVRVSDEQVRRKRVKRHGVGVVELKLACSGSAETAEPLLAVGAEDLHPTSVIGRRVAGTRFQDVDSLAAGVEHDSDRILELTIFLALRSESSSCLLYTSPSPRD